MPNDFPYTSILLRRMNWPHWVNIGYYIFNISHGALPLPLTWLFITLKKMSNLFLGLEKMDTHWVSRRTHLIMCKPIYEPILSDRIEFEQTINIDFILENDPNHSPDLFNVMKNLPSLWILLLLLFIDVAFMRHRIPSTPSDNINKIKLTKTTLYHLQLEWSVWYGMLCMLG